MINYLNAGILLVWLTMSFMSYGAWYFTKVDQFLICAALGNVVLCMQAYVMIRDYKRQRDSLSLELLRINRARVIQANEVRINEMRDILHAGDATDQDKRP